MDSALGRAEFARWDALHALCGYRWSAWVRRPEIHSLSDSKRSKISSTRSLSQTIAVDHGGSDHDVGMPIPQRVLHVPLSIESTEIAEDNVALSGGPTGFDVFVSPVIESWQISCQM